MRQVKNFDKILIWSYLDSFEFLLACQFNLNYIFPQAEVVELADTLCSGRSEVILMRVRLPPSAWWHCHLLIFLKYSLQLNVSTDQAQTQAPSDVG